MLARGDSRPLLAALLLLVPAARADDDRPACGIPGESKATMSRLAEADRRFSEKKWSEGLDELQAILDTAGDDLAPIDAAHSVRARRLVHGRIAALPPEALKRYRDRVDVQARRWLEQAAAAKDDSLLRRIVDEAFCSTPAERALELLGDLAFERGRFLEAQAWWCLLVPPADEPEKSGRFAYPGPRGDSARVRAKQLMALHFQGGDRRLPQRLDAYRARHASAEGILGGRQGKYVDFLAALMVAPPEVGEGESTWTTFGGDATRGRVQPAPARLLDRLSILCRGGPALRLTLPALAPTEGAVTQPDWPDRFMQRSEYSRSLAFHPLIVDHRLVVANAARVLAFDLRQPANGATELYSSGFATAAPPLDFRCTLTTGEGYVYARLGQVASERGARFGSQTVDSRLVCLRLGSPPGQSHLRWVEKGLTGANARKRGKVVFEGTPIVRDGLVYAAAARFEGGRSVTAVHCYDAEATTKTTGNEEPEPLLRWHTDVCESSEATGSRQRLDLLTLAGPLVVCCSNCGAVVALDAASGRVAWAARCRGRARDPDARPPLTDLTPCVYANGRLYAAPSDGNGLYCLDPETGRTLWHREGIDVVHLLGVGAGRLIFATPTGLRAVEAESGGDAGGWSHEARTDYGKDGARTGWTPAGRGFLAGDYVFWPAIDSSGQPRVHALRQDSGEVDDNPTLLHRMPAGNLVYAERCLAVAGKDELDVFVPPAWQLPEREQRAKATPNSSKAALALARAESDAGLTQRAAESYARAATLAIRDKHLRSSANAECQRLWLDAGWTAARARRWAEAKEYFDRSAAKRFAPVDRAAALLEAAEAWSESDRLDDLATTLQTLLDCAELRDARLPGLVRANDRAVVHQQRCDLPNRHQASAAAALAAAKSADDLDQLSRRFARSAAACTALKTLALQNESLGQFGAAADSWRRLAQQQDCPAALAALARCYERQGYTPAARSTWQALAKTHGAETVPEVDPQRKAIDVVAERLRSLTDVAGPTLPLRCFRELTLDHQEIPLAFPGGDLFLTVRPGLPAELVARDVATGSERWRARLPFFPIRAFSHADMVLVVGSKGIAGLRSQDGVTVWTCVPSQPDQAQSLSRFRLTGSDLTCLHGARHLLQINAETGATLRLTPVACRISHPDKSVTCSGTAAGTVSSDPVPSAERRAWLAVDGSRRVVLTGVDASEPGWTYSIPGVTTLTGRPPRVAVVDDAILLLVETNIGYQLQRLDRATGRPLWPLPVRLREPVSDPVDWAAGNAAVCLVEGNILSARSLSNGKLLWETPLGDAVATWHVERLANGLVAYPTSTTARHFEFRWLTEQVQWTVVPDAGQAVGRGLPMVCCDLTGKILQRFDFASGNTTIRCDSAPGGGVSVAPGVAAWRGNDAVCPPVQVSRRGILVVVGPRAWCLAPAAAK